MRRLSGQDGVPEPLRGGIVALGNFDGFHLGHQAVAKAAIDWARDEQRPAIIATFDPHPVRYFRPETPPFRLTTLDQREELFAAAGADAMLVFAFDETLANTSADAFITDLLIDRFGAVGAVTGKDFTFGRKRGGDVGVMARVGAAHGLATRSVGPVAGEDSIVSSSRIRDALADGDCDTATALLTRPFAIRGTVVHGDKNGRELGYPTANIELGQYMRPRYGIYAVKGRVPDGSANGRVLNGAANLGTRPSFDPPKELLEPYFFDFDGDLYGQEIEVELHAFLRPERAFDDMDALSAQMADDCEKAKALLG